MKRKISRRHFLKKSSQIIAIAGFGSSSFLLKGCKTNKDFDLVLKEGEVFDGLGHEGIEADIGILGDSIKEIGKISSSKAKTVIEAKGLAVCSGFIDVHDHTDISLLVNPKAESSIRQGITTVISGNCGYSPFPLDQTKFEEMREDLKQQFDLEYVIVNGRVVINRGQHTGNLPGRILKKQIKA